METKVSNEQMRNVPRNIWRYSEGTENRDRPKHNGTYLKEGIRNERNGTQERITRSTEHRNGSQGTRNK
jgi:hypothetical protein